MPQRLPDFARITRLRQLFLDQERGARSLGDYWRDRKDLAAYDAVLGARIGWKWDAVLTECEERGFARADQHTVLDFGCGGGIAARRFVAHFGAREVVCYDRSSVAMKYALQRLAVETPKLSTRGLADVSKISPDVLLISHVLGELDAAGEETVRALIARSRRVVIVEPGNRQVARRLSTLRDELMASFHVTAPCPHRARCPALLDERDWCHFFATPPPEVFTESYWAKTARELNIDLRSLPYAFLALDREPTAAVEPAERLLGRAEITPHVARLRACTEAELATVEVTKRHAAKVWRALKKRPEQVRGVRAELDEPQG